MPFPLIPTALGLCFLLIWAFIAGMIFRDSQLAARRDRDTDGSILPLRPVRLSSATNSLRGHKSLRTSRTARAAS